MQRIESQDTVDVSSAYGCPAFNPVYIDDAVAIIERACALRGFQLLNVAGPEVVSPQALACRLAEAMGRTVSVGPQETASERNLVLDVARLTDELCYRHAVPLQDGIQRTVAAWLKGTRR
jgi:nucleoside-diphosphate-sugar epimerase